MVELNVDITTKKDEVQLQVKECFRAMENDKVIKRLLNSMAPLTSPNSIIVEEAQEQVREKNLKRLRRRYMETQQHYRNVVEGTTLPAKLLRPILKEHY